MALTVSHVVHRCRPLRRELPKRLPGKLLIFTCRKRTESGLKGSEGAAEGDEETLIHIQDEAQQDMESCNITAREGQKQGTKQLQKGKEMEKTWEGLFDILNSWRG